MIEPQPRNVRERDRDWLDEDTWASIPTYIHKDIEIRAACHRLAHAAPSSTDLIRLRLECIDRAKGIADQNYATKLYRHIRDDSKW